MFGKKNSGSGSGSGGGDDRCLECAGIGGRHNQVRYSEPIPGKTPTRYRTVTKPCPRK